MCLVRCVGETPLYKRTSRRDCRLSSIGLLKGYIYTSLVCFVHTIGAKRQDIHFDIHGDYSTAASFVLPWNTSEWPRRAYCHDIVLCCFQYCSVQKLRSE